MKKTLESNLFALTTVIMVLLPFTSQAQDNGEILIHIDAPLCSKSKGTKGRTIFSTRMNTATKHVFCVLYNDFMNQDTIINQKPGCNIDFMTQCADVIRERKSQKSKSKKKTISEQVSRLAKHFVIPVPEDLIINLYCHSADGVCSSRGKGPRYQGSRIYIDVEDAQQDHAKFVSWYGDRRIADEKLISHVEAGLLHEFAHALFEIGEVGSLGWEEDAADTFALITGLQLAVGNEGYEAKSIEIMEAIDNFKNSTIHNAHRHGYYDQRELLDEHSLPLQRYYNSACLLYGFHKRDTFMRLFTSHKLRHVDPHFYDYRKMFMNRKNFKHMHRSCRERFKFALKGWGLLVKHFKPVPDKWLSTDELEAFGNERGPP